MYCLFKNNIQSFKKQLTDEDLGVLVKGLQKDQVDNGVCPVSLGYSPAFQDSLSGLWLLLHFSHQRDFHGQELSKNN